MTRAPRITGDELIAALARAGFRVTRQKGSHINLYRDEDLRRLTVPVHRGRIIPPGTLSAIIRDADMTVDELRDLL